MPAAEFLQRTSTLFNPEAGSKRQALDALSRRASVETGLAEREILDVLLDRERLGSTGVGRGVAIPHGKLASLEQVYGLFARLTAPIPFDAVDDRPVDLLFLLLGPEAAGADHLKSLAVVSRVLRDRATCELLRAAQDAETVREILTRAARA